MLLMLLVARVSDLSYVCVCLNLLHCGAKNGSTCVCGDAECTFSLW